MHVVRSRRIIARGCNSTPFTHTHAQTIQTSRTSVFYDMRGDTRQFKGLVENEKQKNKKRISPNFQFFVTFIYFFFLHDSHGFLNLIYRVWCAHDTATRRNEWRATMGFRQQTVPSIYINYPSTPRSRTYVLCIGMHRPSTYATTI